MTVANDHPVPISSELLNNITCQFRLHKVPNMSLLYNSNIVSHYSGHVQVWFGAHGLPHNILEVTTRITFYNKHYYAVFVFLD